MSDVVPSYLDLEDPFETQVCTKEIIDPLQEWDFSKFSLNSNSTISNDLIHRTENLLKVDLDNEIVSEDKLRRLVSTAARLLSEHDLLINSRNKLYESMNKMHHLEKEATMKLYSQLNLQIIDEESRRVIVELSEKLGNLSTPAEQEESLSDSMNKSNYLNTTPSPDLPCDLESSHAVERISPKIFSVPPPDPSRPPPGYTQQRFPSMLEPPVMSAPVPMYPNAPPPNLSTPLTRPFASVGRCRPPIMMPLGMPKVHLGHIVPINSGHYHHRRRFSAGSERRGRGYSYIRK